MLSLSIDKWENNLATTNNITVPSFIEIQENIAALNGSTRTLLVITNSVQLTISGGPTNFIVFFRDQDENTFTLTNP